MEKSVSGVISSETYHHCNPTGNERSCDGDFSILSVQSETTQLNQLSQRSPLSSNCSEKVVLFFKKNNWGCLEGGR